MSGAIYMLKLAVNCEAIAMLKKPFRIPYLAPDVIKQLDFFCPLDM